MAAAISGGFLWPTTKPSSAWRPALWDEWTGNPWHLEAGEVKSSLKAVLDALAATRREGIGDDEWRAAALERLGPRPFPERS